MSAAADALMGIFGFKRVEGGMKTDRELLELAAKAHGSLRHIEGFGYIHDLGDGRNGAWWNPLEDDGDALRLVAALDLDVLLFPAFGEVQISDQKGSIEISESTSDDKMSAVRRAIVRAAAAIGEGME